MVVGTFRPQTYAFELCRELRERWSQTRIIMTCWDDQDNLLVADAAYVGAHACVDACISPEDFLTVVERVQFGSLLFTRSQLDLAHQVEELTARQREVLQLAWSDVSTAGIASNLGISVNTVRNIESECRSKLGVTSTQAAALRAKRRGMLE